MLLRWFQTSIAVYIMKVFSGAGREFVSSGPVSFRRSNRLISVVLVGSCFLLDSAARRKDWIGVSAKFGRRKNLSALARIPRCRTGEANMMEYFAGVLGSSRKRIIG